MTDIHILSAARTAIGSFGGSLAGTTADRHRHPCRERPRSNGPGWTAQIGQVVMGHVINTEPRDMYLSRVMAMQAGIPETTPAMNVNRLCGSGAQAIVSAVQALMLGDAEMALAGGAECMSRSPYILPSARFGQKMGDTRALGHDDRRADLPLRHRPHGRHGGKRCAQHGISRADQDAFALESQIPRRPRHCRGPLHDQIVPIEISGKRARSPSPPTNTPRPPASRRLAVSGRVPEGRHGDGGQCVGHQRRGGGAGPVAHRKAAGPGSWAMPMPALTRK
jgi:acetyl-CoA C-acetyltransferase